MNNSKTIPLEKMAMSNSNFQKKSQKMMSSKQSNHNKQQMESSITNRQPVVMESSAGIKYKGFIQKEVEDQITKKQRFYKIQQQQSETQIKQEQLDNLTKRAQDTYREKYQTFNNTKQNTIEEISKLYESKDDDYTIEQQESFQQDSSQNDLKQQQQQNSEIPNQGIYINIGGRFVKQEKQRPESSKIKSPIKLRNKYDPNRTDNFTPSNKQIKQRLEQSTITTQLNVNKKAQYMKQQQSVQEQINNYNLQKKSYDNKWVQSNCIIQNNIQNASQVLDKNINFTKLGSSRSVSAIKAKTLNQKFPNWNEKQVFDTSKTEYQKQQAKYIVQKNEYNNIQMTVNNNQNNSNKNSNINQTQISQQSSQKNLNKNQTYTSILPKQPHILDSNNQSFVNTPKNMKINQSKQFKKQYSTLSQNIKQINREIIQEPNISQQQWKYQKLEDNSNMNKVDKEFVSNNISPRQSIYLPSERSEFGSRKVSQFNTQKNSRQNSMHNLKSPQNISQYTSNDKKKLIYSQQDIDKTGGIVASVKSSLPSQRNSLTQSQYTPKRNFKYKDSSCPSTNTNKQNPQNQSQQSKFSQLAQKQMNKQQSQPNLEMEVSFQPIIEDDYSLDQIKYTSNNFIESQQNQNNNNINNNYNSLQGIDQQQHHKNVYQNDKRQSTQKLIKTQQIINKMMQKQIQNQIQQKHLQRKAEREAHKASTQANCHLNQKQNNYRTSSTIKSNNYSMLQQSIPLQRTIQSAKGSHRILKLKSPSIYSAPQDQNILIKEEQSQTVQNLGAKHQQQIDDNKYYQKQPKKEKQEKENENSKEASWQYVSISKQQEEELQNVRKLQQQYKTQNNNNKYNNNFNNNLFSLSNSQTSIQPQKFQKNNQQKQKSNQFAHKFSIDSEIDRLDEQLKFSKICSNDNSKDNTIFNKDNSIEQIQSPNNNININSSIENYNKSIDGNTTKSNVQFVQNNQNQSLQNTQNQAYNFHKKNKSEQQINNSSLQIKQKIQKILFDENEVLKNDPKLQLSLKSCNKAMQELQEQIIANIKYTNDPYKLKQDRKKNALIKMKSLLFRAKKQNIPLENFAEVGNYSTVAYQNRGSFGFFQYLKKGNFEAVKELLNENRNYVFDFDQFRMTGLHYACKKGYNDIFQELMKYKPDCDFRDQCNRSPFYYALKNQNKMMVKDMLFQGISPFIDNDLKSLIQEDKIDQQLKDLLDFSKKLYVSLKLIKDYQQRKQIWEKQKYLIRDFFINNPIENYQQQKSNNIDNQ